MPHARRSKQLAHTRGLHDTAIGTMGETARRANHALMTAPPVAAR